MSPASTWLTVLRPQQLWGLHNSPCIQTCAAIKVQAWAYGVTGIGCSRISHDDDNKRRALPANSRCTLHHRVRSSVLHRTIFPHVGPYPVQTACDQDTNIGAFVPGVSIVRVESHGCHHSDPQATAYYSTGYLITLRFCFDFRITPCHGSVG